MKPAPFAYVRATSLDDVFDVFDEHGDDARILAGGQSLMATLNMRLSAPAVLVDINAIEGLGAIEDAGDHLRIGALARHAEVAASAPVAAHAPLIAAAMPHIAHAAIRNRGTFGGSLAYGDPAAELPACARALDARFVLQSRGSTRTVAANEFYHGLFETALAPGEVLVAAEIPKAAAGERVAFQELARRRGDYAIVGVALRGRLADGAWRGMHVAYFGAGDRPLLAVAAMAALEGRPAGDDTLAAARAALDDDLDPMADLNGGPATKMHLARVLLGRALAELAQ